MCKPDVGLCSRVLPAVTYGQVLKKIAPLLFCKFCDTDFVGMDGEGGGRFPDAAAFADAIAANGAMDGRIVFVVLTGGEPMLQVDSALIDALHAAGFEIAIESNGTLAVPSID